MSLQGRRLSPDFQRELAALTGRTSSDLVMFAEGSEPRPLCLLPYRLSLRCFQEDQVRRYTTRMRALREVGQNIRREIYPIRTLDRRG